jgi:hypothetical protein
MEQTNETQTNGNAASVVADMKVTEETRELRRLVDVTLRGRSRANIEEAISTLMHVVVKLERGAAKAGRIARLRLPGLGWAAGGART